MVNTTCSPWAAMNAFFAFIGRSLCRLRLLLASARLLAAGPAACLDSRPLRQSRRVDARRELRAHISKATSYTVYV